MFTMRSLSITYAFALHFASTILCDKVHELHSQGIEHGYNNITQSPLLLEAIIARTTATPTEASNDVINLIPILPTTTHSTNISQRITATHNKTSTGTPQTTVILSTGQPTSNAGLNLRIPRTLALPAFVFNTLSSLPRALAFSTPLRSALEISNANITDDTDSQNLGKRQRGCVNCFGTICMKCEKNAAPSLRIPRIFTFPVIILNTLSSLPRALAFSTPLRSALEISNANITKDADIQMLGKRQKGCVNCFGTICMKCEKNAAPSLRIPRIFTFPVIMLDTLSSFPRTVTALAIPHIHTVTNATGTPDFGLIAKAVRDVKDLVSKEGSEVPAESIQQGICTYDGRRMICRSSAEGWDSRLTGAWVVVGVGAAAFAGGMW